MTTQTQPKWSLSMLSASGSVYGHQRGQHMLVSFVQCLTFLNLWRAKSGQSMLRVTVWLMCDICIFTCLRHTHSTQLYVKDLRPCTPAKSLTTQGLPLTGTGAVWNMFFNWGKTHISNQMYKPFLPPRVSRTINPPPPPLRAGTQALAFHAQPLVQMWARVCLLIHVHTGALAQGG